MVIAGEAERDQKCALIDADVHKRQDLELFLPQEQCCLHDYLFILQSPYDMLCYDVKQASHDCSRPIPNAMHESTV